MSNKNNDGEQLLDASKSGDLVTVQRLLSRQSVDVNYTDHNGWTALTWAIINGHIEVIKALLEHNADVDIQDINGWTALMRASYFGHIDYVRLLLEKGANVTLKTKSGTTAKDLAQQRRHSEIVKLLNESNELPLMSVNKSLKEEYQRLKMQIQHNETAKQELIHSYQLQNKILEDEMNCIKEENKRAKEEMAVLKDTEATLRADKTKTGFLSNGVEQL